MSPTPNSITLDAAVAAEVRAEMGRRRISIRSLAARTDGATREWVARRVNGTVPMTTDDIQRIAAPLDLTPDVLVRRASELLAAKQPAA